MKKKILLTILVGIFAIALFGCGDKEAKEEDPFAEIESLLADLQEQEEEVANQFNIDSSVMVKETVLIDDKDVKITLTGLRYNYIVAELQLTIENNSDVDLTFATSDQSGSECVVNGYVMHHVYLNEKVAAGEETNATVNIFFEELNQYGITQLADIQLAFVIEDDDYTTYYEKSVTVQTSAADTYDYGVNTYREFISSPSYEEVTGLKVEYFAEEELYNEAEVRIVSEALCTDIEGNQTILFEVVNDSSDAVEFELSQMRVNDLLISGGILSIDVISPNATCIVKIVMDDALDKSLVEMLGITEVNLFNCMVHVVDMDYDDIVEPKEISLALSEEVAFFDISGEEVYKDENCRIIVKGLSEDTTNSDIYTYVLFLIENMSDEKLNVENVKDTLYVNGYDMSSYMRFTNIMPKSYSVLVLPLYQSDLEDIGVEQESDIEELEIALRIYSNYVDIGAEPEISIQF